MLMVNQQSTNLESNPFKCMALLTLLLIAVLLSGCSRTVAVDSEPEGTVPTDQQTTPFNVAVIDINEVARQIGAMDKIRFAMAEFELELQSQLNMIKDRLDEEVESKKKAYNNDLNQQAAGELDSLLAKHQSSLEQQTFAANSQLAAHHNQLKLKLLNQVRPIAYQVANERGMSVVLTTAQIYAATPTADITNEVVQRIQQINAVTESSSDDDRPKRLANLPGGGDFKPY